MARHGVGGIFLGYTRSPILRTGRHVELAPKGAAYICHHVDVKDHFRVMTAHSIHEMFTESPWSWVLRSGGSQWEAVAP